MTHSNIIYVRALDCTKSPHNVRTQSDAEADAELEANIGETGTVLQNLIGVPVRRKKGQYEIVGGGRRLESVHRNIAAGKLGEDFMVPVLVVKDTKDAIEMSFVENYYNLPMNPADECRAFQGMIEREKKTPADLAKRFGKTERFVLGRLRLANLAEPVFEALRSGEITLDVAKAYGSTADTDRQAKIFDQMAESYHRHNVNEIRRHLATGSFKGGDPKALLVGRDAYVEAGGRIDSDLFSDQASELWRDGDIVERLAEGVMTKAAEAMREREGFAEVRPIASTSVPYLETYQLRPIEPTPLPMSEEAKARETEIEKALAEIESVAEEAEGYTDEQIETIEALHEELETLSDTGAVLGEEQKTGAIAYMVIDSYGRPQLHNEYFVLEESAEEEPEAEGGDDGEHDDDEVIDSGGDEASGDPAVSYSLRLRDELAMMKTELLALHVASDPQFALDLGTFIMVDDACHVGWTGMPSDLRARAPSPRVSGYESDTQAAQAWAKLDDGLDRSWINHHDIVARYDAFCDLDDAARAAWLGWAIARTLHAVPEGASGSDFLDRLGTKLGIDVATWWRPTARNFFDRLSKLSILTLFEMIGGLDLKNRYAASRKFDLAVSAEKLFSGQVIAEAEVKGRALAWLPTPMRFGPEDESSVELAADDEHVGEAATQNEAAEVQSSDSIAEAA